jgi:phosphoribosylpyrophosphate synthetase
VSLQFFTDEETSIAIASSVRGMIQSTTPGKVRSG